MVGSDELKSRLAPSHKLLSFYFRVILTERIGESHVPNLTDDLGTAKERCLNQFGTAVLVWCGKSSTESVKLYLSSTHGTPSKSDVVPVSLHSTSSEAGLTDTPFKGGTSRKLLEGGGGGKADEVPKNIRAREN